MIRAETLRESFRYAFSGLWYALNTQRNFRIHLWVAVTVFFMGWLVGLPKRDFVPVLLAVMVVMVAEMMNTAMEAVVDLASPEYHPLAKVAKDVAAGAVLLAAIGAFCLGIWVFLPFLAAVPRAIVLHWNRDPGTAVLMGVMFVAVTGFVLWIPTDRNRFRRRFTNHR